MNVTFHGQSLRLVGLLSRVSGRAHDVRVTGNNLSLVLPLAQLQGKIRLFLTVLSLDTPTCSTTIQTFSQHLNLLSQELTAGIEVFLISTALPFAQSRWQAIEGITNITMFSDYRDMNFARN